MLLLMEAQDGEWDEVDSIIRLFQNTMMKLKYSNIPVVAAPHQMTLGGGVEVCMAADEIVFPAETYFGLVETGVGSSRPEAAARRWRSASAPGRRHGGGPAAVP